MASGSVHLRSHKALKRGEYVGATMLPKRLLERKNLDNAMKKWKVYIFVGILLPIIGLLFVGNNWVPRLGLIWNLNHSAIEFRTTASSEGDCIRQMLRTPSSTPACGKTVLSVRYKWILIAGIGLVIYGFFLKEKD